LTSDDWRAVPDIWRSSAEKYGDQFAVVDPHHDPPTSMTYKQVTFQHKFSYLFIYLFIYYYVSPREACEETICALSLT